MPLYFSISARMSPMLCSMWSASAANLLAFQERERKLREQLNLALGIANAANSKCSTLQRTVDESSREIDSMHRKIDSMMSCIEQLCNAGGDFTKSVYTSLFRSSPSSSQYHSPNEQQLRLRNGSTDSHMAGISEFFFDESFYNESEGLNPAPVTARVAAAAATAVAALPGATTAAREQTIDAANGRHIIKAIGRHRVGLLCCVCFFVILRHFSTHCLQNPPFRGIRHWK